MLAPVYGIGFRGEYVGLDSSLDLGAANVYEQSELNFELQSIRTVCKIHVFF